jgi:AcrR family transcriptional regulator/DNA-binding MarR family transcriptional regulator
MITARQSSVRAPRRSRAGGASPTRNRISDAQRHRMLAAAAQVVGEVGYGGMSVARVTDRAGVSRRTFYEQFEDREDCFLALFDEALERAGSVACAAAAEAPTAGRSGWRERVRAGLTALVALVEEEPVVGSLLIVDALGGGPKILERRARALEAVRDVIDAGRAEAKRGSDAPPLTAEGVVGAVLSVVHARLLEEAAGHGANRGVNGSTRSRARTRPLGELINPLMAMIVLPYMGQAAAARELEAPTVKAAPKAARRRAAPESLRDPLRGLEMRLTYRTLLVLSAIAEHPGASNRRIADIAEIHDQGQISKLLGRLERLGLIVNGGAGQAKGEANAWGLTRKGEEIEAALSG